MAWSLPSKFAFHSHLLTIFWCSFLSRFFMRPVVFCVMQPRLLWRHSFAFCTLYSKPLSKSILKLFIMTHWIISYNNGSLFNIILMKHAFLIILVQRRFNNFHDSLDTLRRIRLFWKSTLHLYSWCFFRRINFRKRWRNRGQPQVVFIKQLKLIELFKYGAFLAGLRSINLFLIFDRGFLIHLINL